MALNSVHIRRVNTRMFHRLRYSILTCLCAGAVAVEAQTPSITGMSPATLRPGVATEVDFAGASLGGAQSLWTEFSAQVELTSAAAGNAKFKITPAADATPGLYAIRLIATDGLSSLHPMLLDDLPPLASSGTNNTPASAQEIPFPASVDGTSEALKLNYFRFKAKKGQRVSIEIIAGRMGSALDPSLRLLNAEGRSLALNEDGEGLGVDARLSYRIPATGDYLIELRDAKYEGGLKHRYHLRLGDFPLVTTPFPLVAKAGTTTSVEFLGKELGEVKSTAVTVRPDSQRIPLTARSHKAEGSTFTSLLVSQLDQASEAEPNDAPESATKLTLPCGVNGRFGRAGDVDVYEFEATKGAKWMFTGATRSLGSPSELSLRLTDAQGKQLAEANVGGADEGGITNTFKVDGRFRLIVEELTRRGGPDHGYHIDVTHYAGFDLSVETERLEIAPGATTDLKIKVARRDYTGPITLALTGEATGLSLENAIIPEKKDDATLKLKAAADIKRGIRLHIRLVGNARASGTDFASPVSTLPALGKLFPDLPNPAAWDGWIAVRIK